jgi:hypothetical protein
LKKDMVIGEKRKGKVTQDSEQDSKGEKEAGV